MAIALGAVGVWTFGGAPKDERGAGRGQPRSRLVKVEQVHAAPFADHIEAIGTLMSNESVTLTAKTQGIIRTLTFQDSQLVKKGDELAAIDAGEQDAQVRMEAANLQQQRRELERTMQLVKQQHVSQSRVEELEAAVKKAEANVSAASSRAGDRRIIAPFSGIVGVRRISLGALVSPGTPVATLDDLSTMKLDLQVPESFLASLKPGLKIEATVSAYPKEKFTGEVTSIDTRIDPVTRSVSVRAALPNPDLRLRPGMLMVADLIKDERTAVVVPEAALQPENNAQFVYLVSTASTAHKVQVTIGSRRGGLVEILNGVREGDVVIIEGNQDLPEGTPLRIANPPAVVDATVDGKTQQLSQDAP